MSDTDTRVVEMQFNNQQFEKGVKESVKSIQDLKQNLDFDGLKDGLDNLNKETRKFSLDGMASSFQTVEAAAKRFLFQSTLIGKMYVDIQNKVKGFAEETVNAFTTGGMQSGFSEYELKMGSVQTIMNSTGESIETVSKYLEDLNTYADRTIYSFSDMTDSISKFTNAGVDLETSVKAIQGISNVAALAGVDSQKASHAMFNFAQALSTGFVGLTDWMSIENAEMATKDFKVELLETAVAMGTLTKTAEGTYKTKKGDEIGAAGENFRNTLKEQWLTTDVLTTTLGKFADENTELGKRAFAAAQDVRTFSMVMDTAKESVGSGWSQSFELIFGNLEEAKVLWTGVSNYIGKFISESSTARNSMLQEWKDLGGREALIQGLTDAFDALRGIILSVKDAIQQVFPPMTGERLTSLSEKVKEWGANLKEYFGYTEEVVDANEEVSESSEGIFKDGSGYGKNVEGVNKLKDSLNELKDKEIEVSNYSDAPLELDENLKKGSSNDYVKKMQAGLAELGYDVGDVDGIFGPKTEAALKKFQEDSDLVKDGIFGPKSAKAMAEALGQFDVPSESVENAGETVEKTTKTVYGFSTALQQIMRIVKGVAAAFHIVFQVAGMFGKIIWNILKALSPLGNAILEVIAMLGDCFVSWDEAIQEGGVLSGVLESLSGFFEFIGTCAKNAADAILAFFGIGNSAEEAGEQVEGAEDKIKTFPQLWNKIKESVKALPVWGKIATIFDNIKSAFEKVIPVIKQYWEEVKAYLGEKFQGLLGKLGENVPKGIEKVGNFFSNILEGVHGFIQNIPTHLENLKAFFIGVKNFFVGLWNSFQISDKISKAWNFLKDLFADVPENISAFIKKIGDGIRNFFSIFTGEENDATSFVQKIKDFFTPKEDVETVEGEAKEGFFDKIKGLFGKAVEWLKGLLSKVAPIAGIIAAILAAVAPVILVVKTILSINSALKGIGTFTKELGKTFKAFRKGKLSLNGEEQANAFADNLKSIAILIGVIAAAIALIGYMWQKNKGGLIYGTAVIGAVLALIAAMTVVMLVMTRNISKKQVSGLEAIGEIFKNMAIAIGVISAAIFALGSMDLKTLGQGFVAVILLMAALTGAIIAMNHFNANKLELDGLIQFGVAIGILATIAWRLGKMDPWELVQGMLGVLAVTAIITAAIIAINKWGGGSVKLKGLIGMTVAIAILAIIANQLSKVDFLDYLKGLGMLVLVEAALVAVVWAMNKWGGSVKFGGLIGLVLFIGLLCGELFLIFKQIAQMPQNQAWQGILGLAAIIAMLAGIIVLLAFTSSKINLGPTIAVFAGMILLVYTMGEAIEKIKDVDIWFIVGFVGTIAGGLLALSLIFAMIGALSGAIIPGALIVSVFAIVVTILLAIIGGIDSITDGFIIDALDGGIKVLDKLLDILGTAATKIVEIVRDCVNIWTGKSTNLDQYTSDLTTYGGALSDFAETVKDVTAEDIQGAMDASALISAFVTGLPKTGGVVQWWGGEVDFGQFAADLQSFADSLDTFVTVVKGLASYENLEADVTAAIENVAKPVNAFFTGLEAYPMNLSSIEGYNTAAAELSTDMALFGNAISIFTAGVTGLGTNTEIEADTQEAIDIATTVHSFFSEITFYTIDSTALPGYNTAAAQLSTDMTNFGTAISDFTTKISGFNTNKTELDADVTEAIDIAETVKGFFDRIADEYPTGDNLVSYNTALTGLFGDIDAFGTNMASFRDKIKGLSEVDENGKSFQTDVTAATDAATSIKTFLESLSSTTTAIDEYQGFWERLFGEENNTTNFFDQVEELGTQMGDLQTSFAGLSSGTFTSDTETVKSVMETIGGVLTWFSGDEVKIDSGKESNFEKAIEQVGDYADKLDKFNSVKVDPTGIEQYMSGLESVATALATASDNDLTGDEIDPILTAIDTIKTRVNDFSTEGLDTTGFFNVATGIDSISQALSRITSTGVSLEALNTLDSAITKIVESLAPKISEAVATSFDPTTFLSGMFGEDFDLGSALSSVITSGGGEGGFDWLELLKQYTGGNALSEEDLASIIAPEGGLDFGSIVSQIFNFGGEGSEGGEGFDWGSLLSKFVGGNTLTPEDISSSIVPEGGLDFGTVVSGIFSYGSEGGEGFDWSSLIKQSIGGNTLTAEDLSSAIAPEGGINIMDVVSGVLTSGASEGEVDLSSSFTGVGTGIAGAIGSEISSSSLSTDITSLLQSARTAGETFGSTFSTVGAAMCTGIAAGLRNNSYIAKSAARKVASDALAAAKAAIDSNSPSKKFMELGKFSDEGLAIGLNKYSKVVTSAAGDVGIDALDRTGKTMARLSSMISTDVDAEPVIRPVMDLSNVTAGARAIGGIIPNSRTINLSTSSKMASTTSVAAKKSQNARTSSTASTISNNMDQSVNFSGSTFYIRSDQDIHNLASELASLTKQQQRSFGAKY